jgi:hypothetical protein
LFSLVLLDTKRDSSGFVKIPKNYLFAPLRVAPNNFINKGSIKKSWIELDFLVAKRRKTSTLGERRRKTAENEQNQALSSAFSKNENEVGDRVSIPAWYG